MSGAVGKDVRWLPIAACIHASLAPPRSSCSAEGVVRGHFQDLSMAGCYVEIRKPVRGPVVEVVMSLPGSARGLRCEAEILRQELRRDGRIGMALRFVNVDWSTVIDLARLISPQLA